MQVNVRESWALAVYLTKWVCLSGLLGLCVGSASALFLWSLDLATNFRVSHSWLILLLPLAGAFIGAIYSSIGKSVEAGNNLIVDEIHEPGGGVPLRMAPLVLIGTILTHLFGGSAGREGTAVQMGGSLAGGLARLIPGLNRADTQCLLMAGIASGFAGVFGTPVAGMVFALEVLTIGRMNHSSILPCLIAAIASDQTCAAWGVGHTHYEVASRLAADSVSHVAAFDGRLMLVTVVAGIAFGLASMLFTKLAHALSRFFYHTISRPVLRPVVGGLVMICLTWLLGTDDFLGLGVSSPDASAVTIVSSFHAGGADAWSWLWKMVFTTITLSSGFKGGEVTPLFFIGATLGNVLATLFGVPVDLLAAMGFVSVFAGATNTPLACIVMAVELFGGEHIGYFAVSCVIAYLFSGQSGIYRSQRKGVPKPGRLEQESEDDSK